MPIPELNELFIKYFNKTATSAEREKFFFLIDQHKDNTVLLEMMKERYQEHKDVDFTFTDSLIREKIIAITNEPDHKVKNLSVPKRRVLEFSYRWISVASAVIFLFGLILYYLFNASTNELIKTNQQIGLIPTAKNKDQATISLANGEIIVLDTISPGTTITNDGMTISKKDNGQLTYTFTGIPKKNTTKDQENIITVPKGRQYQLVLNDGSEVWLNAKSQLRFPQVFGTDSREVKLEGEGFFEVSKDHKRPFRVMTPKGISIQVLGTQFNLNAYENQEQITTTLIEGSVIMSSKIQSERLYPGQQMVAKSATGKISRAVSANMEQATAWKEGYFCKKEILLSELITQMEHWYDVDIIHNSDDDIELAAHLPRNIELKDLLSLLNMTKRVRCTLDGRTIKIDKIM